MNSKDLWETSKILIKLHICGIVQFTECFPIHFHVILLVINNVGFINPIS